MQPSGCGSPTPSGFGQQPFPSINSNFETFGAQPSASNRFLLSAHPQPQHSSTQLSDNSSLATSNSNVQQQPSNNNSQSDLSMQLQMQLSERRGPFQLAEANGGDDVVVADAVGCNNFIQHTSSGSARHQPSDTDSTTSNDTLIPYVPQQIAHQFLDLLEQLQERDDSRWERTCNFMEDVLRTLHTTKLSANSKRKFWASYNCFKTNVLIPRNRAALHEIFTILARRNQHQPMTFDDFSCHRAFEDEDDDALIDDDQLDCLEDCYSNSPDECYDEDWPE